MVSAHQTADDLAEIGLISKQTMREFDDACLTTIGVLSAEEIRDIRLKAQVSQAVFAMYLNVSVGVVSKWERGEKHPSGTALKLLTVVREKGLEAIA